MARSTPLWQQNSSYTAVLDRLLMTALWPTGGWIGALPTVVANTMNISIPAGFAAVPMGAQGVELCRWDAAEVVTVAASPPSGQSRIDLIVCQVRDAAVDAGANNDFIFSVVTGVPAASNPAVPATPANALGLWTVPVAGAAANLNGAIITPVVGGGLAVPVGAAEYNLAADTDVTSTTYTNVLSGTFRPAGATVKADLSCTGFIPAASSPRTQFQITNGTTAKLVAAPSTPTFPNGATVAAGSALFTGLTPGTLYTFTVQVAVTSGTTWRMRCATQPALEMMRLILANA